jgi:hypothetical protein
MRRHSLSPRRVCCSQRCVDGELQRGIVIGLTDAFGQNLVLGGFRSRVLGVGPQIGYIFPVGDMQGFLGLRGYGEFDAANRPSGWNTWLTFAISPAAPTAVTPTRHLVTK